MYKLLFTSLLLIASAASQAQDSTLHLNLGLSANSALNYYGRVDSLHSQSLSPFIGITLPGGLYANANFVFIHNRLQSRYAATLVEAGYNFHDSSSTWTGNISATKFFYQPNTDLIQSTIKTSAAASISHNSKILDITIGGDIKYSTQLDYGANAGLDHIFRIRKNKIVFLIAPSAYIYAGTQHFTQSWLQQQHLLLIPLPDQPQTQTTTRFDILSFEYSVPLILAVHKTILAISPTYTMPRNTLTPAPNLFSITATFKQTI